MREGVHDGLRLGTLALFGILLNRYDFNFNAIRKEVAALRKDVDTKQDALCNEFLRRTDAIVAT